jgi:hypothetical protein
MLKKSFNQEAGSNLIITSSNYFLDPGGYVSIVRYAAAFIEIKLFLDHKNIISTK